MSHGPIRYPKEINLVRSGNALEIIWDDDHKSLYPLMHLRAICACATCNETHKEKHKPATNPLTLPVLGAGNMFDIESMNLVGRYALGVLWKDQHDSIFPFAALAEQCPCAQCVAEREREIIN